MIHIGEVHLKYNPSYDVYQGNYPFVNLDNREEFDILCPVSIVTGHRTSVQEAILHLTNDNIELANVLIEDLQSTYSDERLSVSERLDLVKQRLSSGSFAEDDAFMSNLTEFIKINYPQRADLIEDVVSESKSVSESSVSESIIENE